MVTLPQICRRVSTGIVLGLMIARAGPAWSRWTPAQPGRLAPLRSLVADGHIDAPTFSLQYPQDSEVTLGSGDDIEIVSRVADAPTLDLHTRARLLREDPADVVSQYIEQLLAEDALVLLYRAVTVDGRSGFRLWLGEQPDPRTGELTNSLVTFVGYGSAETAQMVTYYADDEAEAAVVALHDSFTHLAPPDALPAE